MRMEDSNHNFSFLIYLMLFRTTVDIPKPGFAIRPCGRMLFVGSCFADSIGRRFAEEYFPTTVNPFGVMYNPASILHTVERMADQEPPEVAFFTLGTNHIYILKETGEIVDNCRKRPQRLFEERGLTIEECTEYLSHAVDILRQRNAGVKIVVTVSPIRYAKYGYHESQLSKSVLLLAADRLARRYGCVTYFPAYEIVNDELRDYRFYKPDMLHPSDQTVEYIWERLSEVYLSKEARLLVEEWRPIKEALAHRPFNPESEEYKEFRRKTEEKAKEFEKKWGQYRKE